MRDVTGEKKELRTLTATPQDGKDRSARISHVLFRSMEVVNQLPVEYRWEFTRRHPYYLQFWRAAREFHEKPSADGVTLFAQKAASLFLTAVNVPSNVPPPDPRNDFATLGIETIGGGWESGAVAPAMIRMLAHILLFALPKVERAELGRLLTESAEYESGDRSHMDSVHERLDAFSGDVWKSFPRAPIISLNLRAPQNAIIEAVATLVRRWKDERGISETRRRDDKLEEYLQVWDLREGWVDGAYDGSQERQLHEIATQLGRSPGTVANQYRAAFKYLTGHDYRPELWIRLFGPIKLSRATDPATTSRLALRRPWRTKNLRPVAESVLLPGRRDEDSPSFLEAAGITPSDIALVDLELDIQTLIERGDSDDRIRQELNSEGEVSEGLLTDLIIELRARASDSL